MNTAFILILSIIFTFIGEHILNESVFPLDETGLLNLLIFSIVVLILSLAGILFFARREYKGVKNSEMKMTTLFRQSITKNGAFLKKYAEDKRSPFLLLALFLAGASGIVGGLNGAHYLYYGGVDSWFSVWLLVLIFG